MGVAPAGPPGCRSSRLALRSPTWYHNTPPQYQRGTAMPHISTSVAGTAYPTSVPACEILPQYPTRHLGPSVSGTASVPAACLHTKAKYRAWHSRYVNRKSIAQENSIVGS
eukprot:3198203-Rhodomonas_salina.2